MTNIRPKAKKYGYKCKITIVYSKLSIVNWFRNI